MATDPMTQPFPLLTFEYQSRTDGSNGVPMLIMSWGRRRVGQDRAIPDPIRVHTSQRIAMAWRSSVLIEKSITDAALLLNVPAATAIAWKAHATRGTYTKSAAE